MHQVNIFFIVYFCFPHTSENMPCSLMFKGYRNRGLASNSLMYLDIVIREAVAQRSSQKSRKTARVSFLFKLQARPEGCNFVKKETLTQVLSCEFCEICKNTFFPEHSGGYFCDTKIKLIIRLIILCILSLRPYRSRDFETACCRQRGFFTLLR